MDTEIWTRLKEKNLKITDNRKNILYYIENRKDPFSAEEIFRDLFEIHNINLSTIYRTLNTFVENDLIQRVAEIDGILYYQKFHKEHLHQLICTKCKAVVPIEDCPIDEWQSIIEKRTGFIINSHIIEFRGLCPNCKK